MRRLLVLLLVLQVLPATRAGADDAPVRFAVIGDQGSANEAQRAVAQAMAAVCAAQGCDFVLGTGDNFYSTFNGPFHEYDEQFVTSFEQPFADVDAPFYMSLGNHDQGFDFLYPIAESQVRYSYRTARPSEKWRMPARWYQHDHADAAFFALDTHTLTSEGKALVFIPSAIGLPGAPRDTADPYQGAYKAPQLRWLRSALGRSDAEWKIAYGHHPYISNGESHGDGPADYRALIERELCGKVDLFIAGHDHHLEWLEPVEECPGTQFLISGAGSLPREVEDDRPSYFKAGETPGFLWAEIGGDTFTAEFYDGGTQLLFRRSYTR